MRSSCWPDSIACLTASLPMIREFFLGRCCWRKFFTLQKYAYFDQTKNSVHEHRVFNFFATKSSSLFQSKSFFQFRHIIQLLPRKQLNLSLYLPSFRRNKSLFDDLRFATHMAIRRSLTVNGITQFQSLLDKVRT